MAQGKGHRRSSSLSKAASVLTPPSTPPLAPRPGTQTATHGHESQPAFDVAESLTRLILEDDAPWPPVQMGQAVPRSAAGDSPSTWSVPLSHQARFGGALHGSSSPEPLVAARIAASVASVAPSSNSSSSSSATTTTSAAVTSSAGGSSNGWGSVWSLSTSAWFQHAGSGDDLAVGAAAQPMYTLTTQGSGNANTSHSHSRSNGGLATAAASRDDMAATHAHAAAVGHRRQRSRTNTGPHDDDDRERERTREGERGEGSGCGSGALAAGGIGHARTGSSGDASHLHTSHHQHHDHAQRHADEASDHARAVAHTRDGSASPEPYGIDDASARQAFQRDAAPVAVARFDATNTSVATAVLLAARAAAGRGRRKEALALAPPPPSAAALLAAASDDANSAPRHSYLFVDNGNVFVGAQSMPDGSMDLAVRVNVKELAGLLEGESPCALREVAASRPSNPRICAAWSKIRYHVHNDTRAGSARQALGDHIFETLIDPRLVQQPQTLTLATGDGSHFPQLVEVALSYGWHVVIWSWNRCLSEKFRKLGAEHPLRVDIRLLDEHRHRITFRAPDRRNSEDDSAPVALSPVAPTSHGSSGNGTGSSSSGAANKSPSGGGSGSNGNSRTGRRNRSRSASTDPNRAGMQANGHRQRPASATHPQHSLPRGGEAYGGAGAGPRRGGTPAPPVVRGGRPLPTVYGMTPMVGHPHPHPHTQAHPQAQLGRQVCYFCRFREGSLALGTCQHVHLCRECFGCANWHQCPVCRKTTQAPVYTDLRAGTALRVAPTLPPMAYEDSAPSRYPGQRPGAF